MASAPLHQNEDERLKTLQLLAILDTLEEQAYDDLTFLAAQICDTPIALVSLVDRDRQWFKSHYGLDARETPREYAFCAHAILDDGPFIICNSDEDERFLDNPLVTGEPYVKFYTGVPLVLEGSMPVGTLCVIDHEARKLSESQLHALEALSRQVVSQLELRLKVNELQGLDRIKDNFIAMVSHELRTPLTSIKGSLSLLPGVLGKTKDRKTTELVDIALRNCGRLESLVNDILDASKLDAGKLDMDIQPYPLLEMVEESIQLNTPYVAGYGCNLKLIKGVGNSVMAKVDKSRFFQVLANLISNAAKFSSAGDSLIVDASLDKGMACISVIDNGMGISINSQKNIFKRFPEIDMGIDSEAPRTGLGLNICKSLVEQMGGSIDFKSELGKGSRFYFTIPVL